MQKVRIFSKMQSVSRGKRKEAIIKSIEEQGKLTDSLRKSIIDCVNMTLLEDIYLPYKKKKTTKKRFKFFEIKRNTKSY